MSSIKDIEFSIRYLDEAIYSKRLREHVSRVKDFFYIVKDSIEEAYKEVKK